MMRRGVRGLKLALWAEDMRRAPLDITHLVVGRGQQFPAKPPHISILVLYFLSECF